MLVFDGPRLDRPEDALELVAAAAAAGTDTVVVPVERLDARFFELGNGFAGELLQKLVNYGLRVVVAGDISEHLERSRALADFVRESNRGRQIRFVSDPSALG